MKCFGVDAWLLDDWPDILCWNTDRRATDFNSSCYFNITFFWPVFKLIPTHLSEIPVVLQGRGLSRAATSLGSIFLNYWTLAFSITGASFACILLSHQYSTFVRQMLGNWFFQEMFHTLGYFIFYHKFLEDSYWHTLLHKNKHILLICDKSVATQNLAFLSYWYRKKCLQIHF